MTKIDPNYSSIDDKEFIDDIEGFIEDFTNKNLNYFSKWGFKDNPFDQRPFNGDNSSVGSRRSNSIKILIKELLISFKSYDHILLKAPAGAGKSFLLQEFFAILNNPSINKTLSDKMPNHDSFSIAMIDGFIYKDLGEKERSNYLIENKIINSETGKNADVIIIDNFAPLYEFWHQLYPKYLGQSFIIASIQTSEYMFLESLKNPDIDIPIRESIFNESQIQLKTSDPLEIFSNNINVPIWSETELKELLKLRILNSHQYEKTDQFSSKFFNIIAKYCLGLPGLCLDLAQDILKNAISQDMPDLTDGGVINNLMDKKFERATKILEAFKIKDYPNKLKHVEEPIFSIVNQLNKKTRKDLIKFLLISMGGYHIQTKRQLTVGTDLNHFFSANNSESVRLLAKSLSPTQLAIVLDKKQSTMSYHLNWFQNEDMIDIIQPTSIQAFKNVPTAFEKIILPPSPYAQLFEYILQISPI